MQAIRRSAEVRAHFAEWDIARCRCFLKHCPDAAETQHTLATALQMKVSGAVGLAAALISSVLQCSQLCVKGQASVLTSV